MAVVVIVVDVSMRRWIFGGVRVERRDSHNEHLSLTPGYLSFFGLCGERPLGLWANACLLGQGPGLWAKPRASMPFAQCIRIQWMGMAAVGSAGARPRFEQQLRFAASCPECLKRLSIKAIDDAVMRERFTASLMPSISNTYVAEMAKLTKSKNSLLQRDRATTQEDYEQTPHYRPFSNTACRDRS
jgi:hypothetical protein